MSAELALHRQWDRQDAVAADLRDEHGEDEPSRRERKRVQLCDQVWGLLGSFHFNCDHDVILKPGDELLARLRNTLVELTQFLDPENAA